MIFSMFKRTSAADVMRDQLHEAEVEAAEHQASAEHHQALADMYAARVERLRAALDDEPLQVSVPPAVPTTRLAQLARFAPAGLRP